MTIMLTDEIKYMIPEYHPLKNFQKVDDTFIIELGAGELYKRLKLDPLSLEIFKKFLHPHSLSEIQKEFNGSEEEVRKFCDILINEGLIIEYKNVPDEFKRYNRHMHYYALNSLCPIMAQEKLKNISIALVGMGGIGNWIALNLVGLGIKKLRLIDPDVIEESNLTRQVLFSEADVGKLKVDVAADQLQRRNSHLTIETINETINEGNVHNLIRDTNFVLLSADRPFYAIQKWLNQACLNLNIPLLNVGYSAGEGVMGPLVIPGKSTCLACAGVFNEENYYLQKNNNEADEFIKHFKSPSFSCLNSMISCMASYEIVKFFLGFGECITINHAIGINPLDFSIQKIYCEKKTICKTCQHN